MTSSSLSPDHATRRYGLLLLPAYPLLAIAGVLTQRQVFALLALALLLTALMLPQLLARRVLPWLSWSGAQAGLLVAWRCGLAGLLLEAVPVLINALLAGWFGRTLGTAEPLVARFIVAIEGDERLRQPGVAAYARQITWFWAVLLAAQALLLAVLLLCADHDGLLARVGVVSPLPVPAGWAATWLHLGGYLLLAAAFTLEYVYRRWRLRHLHHPGLHDMLLQLALHWPQLLRGKRPAAP
ncbi:MAG: xanthomonadin biosynthesis protein [Rhodanobacter sp.]|uniref:xanthomonadin biosynthesis protein n=1 Tax=Rhodanobacter sp. KK11 TaxID=3083255 RepID=UPI0029668DE8|nr:xanthomonadin biosynthesis protein [Rhodanobacter sp. KK11]MDW2983117.1 xanthomonadin biosynthesis protein [Rhodanobacter sp. KK11]